MLICSNRKSSLLSIISSACLTLVLFLLLLINNPFSFLRIKSKYYSSISIEWQIQESNKQENLSRRKFAEANPTVPSNVPDKTNLLSTKDQQSAQPSKIINLKEPSPVPESFGTSENLKVVPVQKFKKQEIQPIQHSTPALAKNLPSKEAQSFTERLNSFNGEGQYLDSSIGKSSSKTINLSSKNNLEPETLRKYENDNSKIQFKPRPKLSMETLNGPILKSSKSVARIGRIAIDARLNPYGIYMQEMLKSIENQWGELIRASFRYIQRESFSKKITYSFNLLKSGKIEHLQETNFSGQLSLASEICRQAIASRAPFGEWDESMIEEFGESDQISITFNYF